MSVELSSRIFFGFGHFFENSQNVAARKIVIKHKK